MKKMLKPEIEFVKFNAEDIITTSGEAGPVSDPSKNLFSKDPSNIETDNTNKSLTKSFTGLSWNNNLYQ